MLSQGIALLPDAGSYCSYHARPPEGRAAMQRRGGQHSPKREAKERAARAAEPDPMPKQFALASYRLIEQLLSAKLDGTFPPESDFRKQAVGAYLASQLYTTSDSDRAHFAYRLVSRDLRGRSDLLEAAEDELRTLIDELEDEAQHTAWKIIGAA